MSAVIEMSKDIEQLVTSAEAFNAATAEDDRARLLAQLRDQLEKLQTFDEKVWSDGAERTSSVTRKDESDAAAKLISYVSSLQRYLTDTSPDTDPEAHGLLQKAVNIAIGYVAGYQDLRRQLISSEAELLRAMPVKGEVDHEALSREFMARFPKLRAALAK